MVRTRGSHSRDLGLKNEVNLFRQAGKLRRQALLEENYCHTENERYRYINTQTIRSLVSRHRRQTRHELLG